MERVYINKISGEDFNFPDSFKLSDLFPNYMIPFDFGDARIDVNIEGGKACFLFGEAQIECFFEFFDDQDHMDTEGDFDEERVSKEIIEFLVGHLADIFGEEVEWNGK